MSYRGVYKNGVVVLQPGIQLAEGTELVVSTAEDSDIPTLGDLFREVAGQAKDKPADGSARHDHYIYGTAER